MVFVSFYLPVIIHSITHSKAIVFKEPGDKRLVVVSKKLSIMSQRYKTLKTCNTRDLQQFCETRRYLQSLGPKSADIANTADSATCAFPKCHTDSNLSVRERSKATVCCPAFLLSARSSSYCFWVVGTKRAKHSLHTLS